MLYLTLFQPLFLQLLVSSQAPLAHPQPPSLLLLPSPLTFPLPPVYPPLLSLHPPFPLLSLPPSPLLVPETQVETRLLAPPPQPLCLHVAPPIQVVELNVRCPQAKLPLPLPPLPPLLPPLLNHILLLGYCGH